MNFKCLCVASAVICLNGMLCNAESELAERNVTSSVNNNGDAVFMVREGTVGKKLVIELSKYPDFSVIDGYGFKKSPTSFPVTIEMKKENRVNGTYYWRIAEETQTTSSYSYQYFYGKDRTVTYGAKIPGEYAAIEDSTPFVDFDLDDEHSLQLKSVWFRSVNTDNRGSKIIDLPHATVISPVAATEFTPDQSVVVKNDVIYISRGSSSWISGWRTDRTRVWLARYDLLTGEELPLLSVKAPDPDNGFASGKWSLMSAMNWIKADDDGTPYFFVTCSNSERPYLSQINLYTLNLDNLPVETQAVTATLTLQIEDDRAGENSYGCPFDMTVQGSIKSGNYKLWGIDYMHGASLKVNDAGSGRMAVWQWNVTGAKAQKNVSYVDYVHSLQAGRTEVIQSFYPHFTPVGNDYFYFHSSPVQKDDPWISPMLYRFVNGGTCEVAGHFGNCRDIVTDIFPAPAGVSAFKVGDTQFLAYGQGIDATRGTGVQIVATPSVTDDFSAHRRAWMLGEKTGLSTNRYQSSQVIYLPDEPVTAKSGASSSVSTGGRLLMYAGNAGMGLYRINALSPTVGVDAITDVALTAAYSDGAIKLSGEVPGIALYDISGRMICDMDETSDTYAVGSLPSGCYILVIRSSAAPVKIIVR